MSDQDSSMVQDESRSNRLVVRAIVVAIVILVFLTVFYLAFREDSDLAGVSQDPVRTQEADSESEGAPGSEAASESEGEPESEIASTSEDSQKESLEPDSSDSLDGIELDIVRVEPTGELLVAGRFKPNSIVIMESDNEEYGRTTANDSGEWVIVSDEKLKPGSYLFQFFYKLDEDSEKIADKTEITVHIPENEEEVLVLLNREGQATEIVQLPESEDSKIAESDAEEIVESEAEESVESDAVESVESDVAETGVEKVLETGSNFEEYNLSIRAVEVEGDKLFIAGEGKSGIEVTVFVGEEKAGSVKANNQDRWLLETEMALETGTHDIIAKILDRESGEVLASVKVQFEKLPESDILRPLVTVEHASGSGSSGSTGIVTVGSLPNVIIRKGDNLWTISRRLYGRGIRYTTIYQANINQIDDPDLIFPGQVFLTPVSDANWKEQ